MENKSVVLPSDIVYKEQFQPNSSFVFKLTKRADGWNEKVNYKWFEQYRKASTYGFKSRDYIQIYAF